MQEALDSIMRRNRGGADGNGGDDGDGDGGGDGGGGGGGGPDGDAAPLTVVCIAHRLSTVKGADRILVLDDGRIVEEGNHASLMAVPGGKYASLVRHQQDAAQLDAAALAAGGSPPPECSDAAADEARHPAD